MRTIRYFARLVLQGLAYSIAERRILLLLVLVLAPLLILVAFLVGVASPFVVYPFV